MPSAGYFSDVLIDVKLVLSAVPTPLTAAMMATAMPAAIRPYSIAVAPDWSFANAASNLCMFKPHSVTLGASGAIARSAGAK